MKVLVTGGTGFIGSHVVDQFLSEGHTVRIFSRRPELPAFWKDSEVSLFRGDLRSPGAVIDAMDGVDIFIHIGEIKNTSKFAAKRNVELAEHIVENLKLTGIKRFVFISSITVAGIPATVPATEDTPAARELKDHYTEYKRTCEKIIRESTVEHAILRPGVVYGPRSVALPRILRRLKLIATIGLPLPGRGEGIVPLIDVRDLSKAVYLAAVKSEGANQTFNITDGLRHTWSDFLSASTNALGSRLRILPVPGLVLQPPALLFDILGEVVGLRTDLMTYISYLTSNLFFDPGRARRLLGWEPVHTDITTGIREMFMSYS